MRLFSILPVLGYGAFPYMNSICGIEQMQGMFAACPGGENFNLQSPNEVAEIDFTCWDTHVDSVGEADHDHRRRRSSFKELITNARSRRSATCPVSSFDRACKAKLKKGNGNCKDGKKARCTLCSKCDDYSSGWCATCAYYGDRTEVTNKNHVQVGNLKSCLANNNLHVPNKCIKNSFRSADVSLPTLLNDDDMASVTVNNIYDTVVMVVNVQVEDNDDGATDKWNQLKEIVKTAVYQFDESMISNFFVIFEGRDNLAKIYGSHPSCNDLSAMHEAMAIVDEEMNANGGVSFDVWDSLMKDDSQWGSSFMGILEYMGNLLNKGEQVEVAGNVAVVHYQMASDSNPTVSMTRRAIKYHRRFKDAHPEITNIRVAFNYLDQAAPHKHDLRQVIDQMSDTDMSELTFESFGRTVYAGGIINEDILVMGYSTTPRENMVNFYEIQRQFFDGWGEPKPTSAPTVGPINDRHICQANNPCQNGCSCQPSCRDHMDYVCTPQPGFPFVGKNCEWPVVAKCLAGNTIHVDIPEEAIDAYELSINNGILHGCNRADFMCDAQTRTCGPVKKADFNGKYSLDCTTSSMQSVNGVFTFSQTFVVDRDSALIHMPIPIVTVACQMQTGSTQALLDPQMRPPQTKDYQLIWTPRVRFYKTPFDVVPGIEANNGNVINNNGNPEVAYVVGEKIHVRVTGVLDNLVPSGNFQVRVDNCHITQINDNGNAVAGSTVNLITNGMANSQQVPVGVERNPGMLTPASGNPGAGFWFQMFTFRAGSKLQMFCSATFSSANSGRKRRSAEEEEEDEEHEFTLTFRVLEDGELNPVDPDVPVITGMTESPIQSYEDEIQGRSIPLLADALSNDSTSEFEAEIEVETTFLLKVLLLTTFICLTMLIAYQIVAHRRGGAKVFTTDEKLMLQ